MDPDPGNTQWPPKKEFSRAGCSHYSLKRWRLLLELVNPSMMADINNVGDIFCQETRFFFEICSLFDTQNFVLHPKSEKAWNRIQ